MLCCDAFRSQRSALGTNPVPFGFPNDCPTSLPQEARSLVRRACFTPTHTLLNGVPTSLLQEALGTCSRSWCRSLFQANRPTTALRASRKKHSGTCSKSLLVQVALSGRSDGQPAEEPSYSTMAHRAPGGILWSPVIRSQLSKSLAEAPHVMCIALTRAHSSRRRKLC